MGQTSKKLGFGIVGFGNIAGHHIKSILELDACELVAISVKNQEKLMEASDAYNVEVTTDFHAMVLHPDIDVISICTPSGFHLEPALAAAAAGKHVITEKPLEINVERGKQMIKACAVAGVKLACIFQNRYSTDYQKLVNAVKNDELGRLVLGNAYIKWFRDQAYYDANDWRGSLDGDGGAALINQSIHTIDLMLNLMGPVKSVIGKVSTLAHEIEGEDIGLAILEFESGALGTIEGSTAIHEGYPEKLEIHGQYGNIILEAGKLVEWNTTTQKMNFGGNQDNSQSGSSDPMAIDYILHKRQIGEICDHIIAGEEAVVNGEEALKSVAVIQAIYESAKSGKQIMMKDMISV